MAKTAYKYRVWCSTESAWVYEWAESEPADCPNNNGHTIDTAKTAIVESVSNQDVSVIEEDIPTGGHFQTKTVVLSSEAVETVQQDVSFPYPVSILSAQVLIDAKNVGDELEVLVAPDTITGTLAADVASGATIINVSQTVVDNAALGFHLTLYDGTNTNDLGRITDISGTNITFETETTKAFAAATPTYVKQTVKFFPMSELVTTGRLTAGETKIGGSYFPANQVLRIVYKNNDGVTKKMGVMLEYLY